MSRRDANSALQRFGRPLKRLVVAMLVLELLYVAGANLFLNSEWGRSQLNRQPEKLAMEWQSAWTFLPGVVRVRELELSGRARRAIWRAELCRAWLVIWLPSLLNRHLLLLSGQASGSSIEVETVAAPETARPERQRRGWRISIDRLDLSAVEQLRFGGYRLEGSGRLRGAVSFEVRGSMLLDFTEFSFHRARVLAGDQLVADALTLDAAFDVDEITIGEATFADLLAGTSGELELAADASSLGFVTAYLQRFPWIDVGGAGHLDIDLEMTDGWLAPGSTLDFDGPAVSATYLGLRAHGAGRVRGRVPEGAGQLRIEAELDAFAVERELDHAELLIGEALKVVITNDGTAIDRPAEGIVVQLRLPPARVPDLSVLGVYLPESTGLSLTGGEGEISAALDYDANQQLGHGWLSFAGRQVVAELDGSALTADVTLDARFPRMQLDAGTHSLDGSTLEVSGVHVERDGSLEASDWWGKIRVTSGLLSSGVGDRAAAPAVVEGVLVAELLDTTPLTAVIQDRVPKLGWFDKLLTVENVALESNFRLAGSEVHFGELRITGGAKNRLEILAELDLRQHQIDGVLLAAWGPLTAAVLLDNSGRDWKLTRSRRWYGERAAEYRSARDGDSPSQ